MKVCTANTCTTCSATALQYTLNAVTSLHIDKVWLYLFSMQWTICKKQWYPLFKD